MKKSAISIIGLMALTAPAWSNENVSMFGFTYPLPSQKSHYKYEMALSKDEAHANLIVDSSLQNGTKVILKNGKNEHIDVQIEEQMLNLENEPLNELWCSDFLNYVGDDVKQIATSDDQHTYSFTPKPLDTDDDEDKEFLSNMLGQITIDAISGDLLHFQMTNKAPFRPVFFAKIKHFHLSATCKSFDDKFAYVARFTTNIEGKIAFKRFEENEERIVTNLEEVK